MPAGCLPARVKAHDCRSEVPGRDIAIEIIGSRPGEKLHEDLFNPYERPEATPAQKILRAAREPLDPQWVEQTFGEINLLVLEGDAAALAAKVAELSELRGIGAVPDLGGDVQDGGTDGSDRAVL